MGGTSSVEVPGGGTEGYHVLKVQENSPGHKAGLESFFDYIIAANGIRLVSAHRGVVRCNEPRGGLVQGVGATWRRRSARRDCIAPALE
jgi:hypothetical protein